MADWSNSVQEIQAIEDENFLDTLDLALWNHLIPPELPQDERRALLKRHRNPRSWHQRLTENLAKETDMTQIEEVKNLYFPVLDQGFVALVDHMGGDDAVIRAARTSYGKGTKKTSTDRGLLRYLMRHRHCYDAETEVLTEDGFIPWPEVKEGVKLGIWDNEAGTLCYEAPEYLTCDPYMGSMYRVDHGGVDLLVTPDHKMWVRLKDQWDGASKSQGWSGYRLIPATELGDRSCVRYSKLAPMVAPAWDAKEFPPCKDPQALLELIGFFIGDGSARGTRANGIDFHLKKDREIRFLQDCVERVGWGIQEFPSYGGRRKFCVYAPGIGHQFEQMFYWTDTKKHLPDWCLRLDRDDAASLLNGMRHSDGTEHRGAWVYYTGSFRLAEQVQILGLHAGEACHINKTVQPDPYDPMYRVTFLSRMCEPVINQGKTQTRMEHYSGNVYCAKTRTGVLVVRRNGKIVLSGNTTPFEMVEMVFHIGMPMDAWRQQIRHRTANVNEYSTRYSEAIDVTATTATDKWRLQSDSNKQGSGGYLEDSEVSRQLSEREAELHKMSREIYEERLKAGIAREQARKDLPLSTYTMAYWKCDLHNLLHFLTLRCDTHAQLEIRSYAMVMAALANVVAPVTVEAWVDYHHCGAHFSRQERLALIEMAKTGKLPDPTQLGEMGLSNREVAEFVKKLTVPPVIPDLSLDLAKGLPPEHFGAIYGAEKSG